MTSRDLADLVEKRHDNVKRTIETLAGRGTIGLPPMEEKTDSSTGGHPAKVFMLPKRETLILVFGRQQLDRSLTTP